MFLCNKMFRSTFFFKLIVSGSIVLRCTALEAVQIEVKQTQVPATTDRQPAQSHSKRAGSHLIYPLPETVPPPIHVLRLKEPGASALLPAFPLPGSFATYFGRPIIPTVHVVQVLYGT